MQNLNTIAIIDDDEIFLMLIKKFIEHKKVVDKVLEFSNASNALSYFTNNSDQAFQLPSKIFLDLIMPDMGGWRFLKELNKINFISGYNPSVIIISGSENIDYEKMRDYTFVKGFITKPFKPGKLIEMIGPFNN